MIPRTSAERNAEVRHVERKIVVDSGHISKFISHCIKTPPITSLKGDNLFVLTLLMVSGSSCFALMEAEHHTATDLLS